MAVRNYTWTNGGATSLWGDSSNWDGTSGVGYPGDGGGTDNVSIIAGTDICDQNTGGHITIQDLTVSGNNASHDLELNAGLLVQGNVSIDAGEVRTQGLLFNVASGTTLGVGTGNNAALLVCADSTCSFGSGYTAGAGLEIKVGGTFSGGTGEHTMGSLTMANSNNARATLTAGNTIIDSEDNSGPSGGLNLHSADTFSHGDGTIIFTYPSYTLFRPGSPNVLNNVILSGATEVKQADSTCVMEGYLTILSGTYTTNDFDLNVSGTTTVGGGAGASLICNDSTCRFGDAQDSSWGILMAANGTFNGGGGTHTTGGLRCSVATAAFAFSDATTTIQEKITSSNRFFTFEAGNVTHSSGELIITAVRTSYCQWEATAGDNGPWDLTINHSSNVTTLRQTLTVLNDLKITAGELDTYSYGSSKDLTVDGDAIIDNGGTLTGNGSAISFRSLEVKNGGTYDATSGVTTLDGETPGGECLDFEATSTFNHNNGTIKFDGGSNTRYRIYSSDACYNLEVDGGGQIYFYTAMNVDNNVTVTDGKFVSDQPGATVDIEGSLFLNNGTFGWTDGTWTADTSFGNVILSDRGAGASPKFRITSGTTTIKGNLINHGGEIY